MDSLITQLLDWLQSLATGISLEVFVFVGAFLEEIIAPIPSPFVMTNAAALSKVQAYSWLQIGILIVLAAIAKTASSAILYVVVDKAEDVVLGKFGKYVGVTHKQIEKIGSFLSESWWDDVLLLLARALPFVPTSLVTVAAGAIRYKFSSFVIMTFLGTILRNLFYFWVGYFGWSYVQRIWDEFSHHPLGILSIIVGIGIAIYAALKVKDLLWSKVMK